MLAVDSGGTLFRSQRVKHGHFRKSRAPPFPCQHYRPLGTFDDEHIARGVVDHLAADASHKSTYPLHANVADHEEISIRSLGFRYEHRTPATRR